MDQSLLLRAVQEVSLIVDRDNPTAITQHAFDEARSQSAVANVPRAKRIVEQLNAKRRVKRLTWARVLELAHAAEGEQVNTLIVQDTIEQTWLTDKLIVSFLRLVAYRLKTSSFSAEQYATELHKMHKEGIQIAQLRIPSPDVIIRAMARKLRERERAFPVRVRTTKTATPTKAAKRKLQRIGTENAWKAALEMADIEPIEHGYLTPPVVTPVDLLERCYAVHKTQLTEEEAYVFARANEIPFTTAHQKLTWTESVAQWKRGLEARGIIPPDGPPPINERPEYSQNVGAGRPGERRLKSWTSLDACLPPVIAYLEQLPANQLSTYIDFARWMRGEGWTAPTSHALRRHGGWNKVRALAHERMNPGQTSASQPEAIPPSTSMDEKTGRRIPKTKVRAASKPTAAPRQATRSAQTQAKPSKDKEAPDDPDPVSRLQRQSFRMPAQPRGRRRRRA